MASKPQVGFYGKLPGRADFVVRGLPESFLTPLGDWIERCLAGGRSALGARWADAYLTSPAWQFALSAGLAGAQAVVGVMVPSADKMGREYPLVIATCSTSTAGPVALAMAASPWLNNAAEIAVAAVTRNADPAKIEAQLTSIGMPVVDDLRSSRPIADKDGWRISGPGAGILVATMPRFLDHALSSLGRPSLWWSEGSVLIEPTTIAGNGLPEPRRFVAMISGK